MPEQPEIPTVGIQDSARRFTSLFRS
jgi:hypothetical protein